MTVGVPQQQPTSLNSWMPQHHRATTQQRRQFGIGGLVSGDSNLPLSSSAAVVAIGDLFQDAMPMIDRLLVHLERLQTFLKENEIGRGISVLLPFVGLILTGAVVIGTIEGWTPVESLYWYVTNCSNGALDC